MEKLQFHKTPGPNDPKVICDFLSFHTGLSKQHIKQAMQKGAVWVKPAIGGRRRIRRATSPVHAGDRISLYYDPKILTIIPPVARCIFDVTHYSIWFKPSGLLSQGSEWGDHCALLRQAEMFFTPRRKSFLVHRLDREASGVMIIAHTPAAASRLSTLFQRREITKHYLIEVMGIPGGMEGKGTIAEPLDGRPAGTTYIVRSYNAERQTSVVSVSIETGRKHQIRRHFELIGCPVMGDPVYGKGNKDAEGLKLSACGISFTCPFTGQLVNVRLDASDIPWALPSAV